MHRHMAVIFHLSVSATASEILSHNCHYTTYRKLDSHMSLSAGMHSNCSHVAMNFYQCTRSRDVLCVLMLMDYPKCVSSVNVLSQMDQIHD